MYCSPLIGWQISKTAKNYVFTVLNFQRRKEQSKWIDGFAIELEIEEESFSSRAFRTEFKATMFRIKTVDCRYGYTEVFKIAHAR